MAADSGSISRDVRCGFVRKIARGPRGSLGGASGRSAMCARFRKWIEDGEVYSLDMNVEPGDFGGFLVCPDGTLFIVDNQATLFEIEAPFLTEGSGGDIALGAMARGASAEEAVAIAIHYECGCGGPIQVERL